jgi:hypothetical protein
VSISMHVAQFALVWMRASDQLAPAGRAHAHYTQQSGCDITALV